MWIRTSLRLEEGRRRDVAAQGRCRARAQQARGAQTGIDLDPRRSGDQRREHLGCSRATWVGKAVPAESIQEAGQMSAFAWAEAAAGGEDRQRAAAAGTMRKFAGAGARPSPALAGVRRETDRAERVPSSQREHRRRYLQYLQVRKPRVRRSASSSTSRWHACCTRTHSIRRRDWRWAGWLR